MFQKIDIFRLERDLGVFLSAFIARRCFWELPVAQFGVLGRSWGSGRPLGMPLGPAGAPPRSSSEA